MNTWKLLTPKWSVEAWPVLKIPYSEFRPGTSSAGSWPTLLQKLLLAVNYVGNVDISPWWFQLDGLDYIQQEVVGMWMCKPQCWFQLVGSDYFRQLWSMLGMWINPQLDLWTYLLNSCSNGSLVPRPHLSQGKGSGDNWIISWLCWVNSIDFRMNIDYVLGWCRAYFIGLCAR